MNPTEGVDVQLSRAAATSYQAVAVAPSIIAAPETDDQSNDRRVSFLRLVVGAAIAGATFDAVVLAFTVASDLPGPGTVLASYVPGSLASIVERLAFYGTIGFGLIGLPLGWFLRGAGVLGGIVGVWLTGFLPSGDSVAKALNPLASHLGSVDLGGLEPPLTWRCSASSASGSSAGAFERSSALSISLTAIPSIRDLRQSFISGDCRHDEPIVASRGLVIQVAC